MSTINYIKICRSQNVDSLEVKKDDGKIFTKKKSEETIQKERLDRRYNSRKNICSKCFTTRASNKECNCE